MLHPQVENPGKSVYDGKHLLAFGVRISKPFFIISCRSKLTWQTSIDGRPEDTRTWFMAAHKLVKIGNGDSSNIEDDADFLCRG
jgi:hypothetical protein